MMIKSFKIGLKPTKEQEELMWKSVGISRFAYNWGINKAQEYHEQGRKYSINDIRKELQALEMDEDEKNNSLEDLTRFRNVILDTDYFGDL